MGEHEEGSAQLASTCPYIALLTLCRSAAARCPLMLTGAVQLALPYALVPLHHLCPNFEWGGTGRDSLSTEVGAGLGHPPGGCTRPGQARPGKGHPVPFSHLFPPPNVRQGHPSNKHIHLLTHLGYPTAAFRFFMSPSKGTPPNSPPFHRTLTAPPSHFAAC